MESFGQDQLRHDGRCIAMSCQMAHERLLMADASERCLVFVCLRYPKTVLIDSDEPLLLVASLQLFLKFSNSVCAFES